MNIGAKARQYAAILLKAAGDDGLDEAYKGLTAFYSIYKNEARLKTMLLSRRIEDRQKETILSEVFDNIPSFVRSFVVQLASRNDLKALPIVVKTVEKNYFEIRKLVNVHVLTSTELPAETMAHIESSVQSALGKKPLLETMVDASLLGGLKLRVGNTIVDGSLSSKLQQLKRILIQS
jgi:F-type H+-transporting ATPase subunit delta